MLNFSAPALVDAPVVCDHRGDLAYLQRSGFLPFEPSAVEWGISSRALPDITGPAGFVSLLHPDKVTLIPRGAHFTPSVDAPYIAFSPAASATPAEICDRPHTLTTVDHCHTLEVSSIAPGRFRAPASFPCRRIYYIYRTPAGAVRGGHSHIAEHRLLVALTGSMRVVVTDSVATRSFLLTSPAQALYIPPGIWREIDSFEAGAVCLALSSTEYDPADYVRSFATFTSLKQL